MMNMLILVDSNEEATSPRTVLAMREYFVNPGSGNTLMVTKLQAGDVNIPLPTGLLMIERKEASDFLGSIGDGRLKDQVERMQNIATFCAIIIVGKFIYDNQDMVCVDGEQTKWRGTSVRAAITAVQWSGVPIIFSERGESYCKAISEIVFTASKESHGQALRKRRTITFPPVDERVEKLANALPPGMGIKMADSLLRTVASNPTEDDPYGTMMQAMEYVSLFGCEEEAGGNIELVRPPGWGIRSMINTRIYWGLKQNQYISIETVGGKK